MCGGKDGMSDLWTVCLAPVAFDVWGVFVIEINLKS